MHRCITFILSSAAAVFNVTLKSAKTHSSITDSAKNTEHVAVSGEHSQNHVYWRAAQGTPISHSPNRILHMQNRNGRGRTAPMLCRHVEPVGRLRTFRSHVTLPTLTLTSLLGVRTCGTYFFVFQVLHFPVLQFPVPHFPVLHFSVSHFQRPPPAVYVFQRIFTHTVTAKNFTSIQRLSALANNVTGMFTSG